MDELSKGEFSRLRREMVETAIHARGVRSELVLDAMRTVPRESFLPERLREFAYEDTALPIEEGQTISQPYIVALMTEALVLRGGEKVLEIGTGSGYAAAVLSEIAAEVHTVERHGPLAEKAAVTLADLGYGNVHVLHGDGTRGWPAHAPYDAIIVAAGGPTVPESLKHQLKIGGRLVIPVGADQRAQELIRVTRTAQNEYRSEELADVRFVPLLGEEGWAPEQAEAARGRHVRPTGDVSEEKLVKKITDAAEPFASIDTADLGPLLERVGDAYLAIVRHQTNNIGGGILTVYLIGTGWLTARRRRGNHSIDWVVLLIPLTLGILTWMNGLKVVHSEEHFARRSSGRNDLFHGFRDAAGRGGGRSHACTRRCSWSQAHRAASLAHVLWPVHRGRIFFPGAVKPSVEIAFGSGPRATLVPDSIQHPVVLNSQRPPTGHADFLAVRVRFRNAYQGSIHLASSSPDLTR